MKKDDERIQFTYNGRDFDVPIEGNLQLRQLSNVEIKDKLNKLPGRFAYWKALQVDVSLEIEEAKEAYEIWFAKAYDEIASAQTKKPTETWIKNHVILDNPEEYRKLRYKIKALESVKSKIEVLTKAYDMQSWTLRSIASVTIAELSNIEAKGVQSLDDLD